MSDGPDPGNDEGLPGTPSDQLPEILVTGRGDITTLFVSMSARHPRGEDARYLHWHTLDHRPEQHRLATLRSSLRIVSTPACRAARAACDARCEAIDHVMTYFFSDPAGLADFDRLSTALRDAGRVPELLPPVFRGVYRVASRVAAARARVGADVLPWWPTRGVYLLLEENAVVADALTEVPGVAGVWSASATASEHATAVPGQQITYCFLDEDPVVAAATLRPVLERRWADTAAGPLLAAPFYPVVPYEWDRYLP